MAEPIVALYRRIAEQLTAPGAAFELAEARLGGRRCRIYRHAPQTLAALFAEAEAAHAERAFLLGDGGERLSFGDTFAAARRLSAALQERFGVRPGDRVAIAMRNRPEWVVAFAAIVLAGGVAVLVNSRGAPEDLAGAVAETEARVVFADGRRAALIGEALPDAILVIPRPDLAQAPAMRQVHVFDQLVEAAGREAAPAERGAEDPVLIMFTSGTTGGSKGVVITNANIAMHAANLGFMFRAALAMSAETYGVAVEQLAAMAPPPGALLVFPLFHTSGLTVVLIALLYGGRVAMLRRWRPAEALELIERERLTSISGPPMVLIDMLEAPGFAECDLSSVNSISCSGQASPPNLSRRIAEAFPRASQGCGWGMTELTGSAAGASGALFAAYPGACGPVLPVMDLRIVGEDGRDRPAGEPGEIWARGPLVMAGYWKRPDAEAEAFEGEWFKTGDVGLFDAEGLLHIVDRKKDMLISAGENIYCAEVERVIAQLAEVQEVAVFGVPDARLGERAVAAVRLRPGAALGVAEIKAAARAGLADYKTPAEVIFEVAPLPRNGLGKVDKAALRRAYGLSDARRQDQSAS
jgi:acyl-CoA synthetase (AMP-forming)/AMP-acid ligase II